MINFIIKFGRYIRERSSVCLTVVLSNKEWSTTLIINKHIKGCLSRVYLHSIKKTAPLVWHTVLWDYTIIKFTNTKHTPDSEQPFVGHTHIYSLRKLKPPILLTIVGRAIFFYKKVIEFCMKFLVLVLLL